MQCLYMSAYESHRNRVREPVDGTCIWVTEHPKYKDWLGKKASGLLWLSADPGCGKSVIASFLANHLRASTDAVVCYFFFKDDSEEQRRATSALCAILHQLFARRSSLYKYATEEFTVKGKRFTEEVEILWKILVKAVAEEGCGDVICVVGGLHECEEGTQAQLLRLVNCLPGTQAPDIPLKFLVTSCPYHKIERGLGSQTAIIRLKGEDEVISIAKDVSRVIDDGVQKLESYWGQPGGLGYLRNLLESSADRTFLWVSLFLGILRDSEDDSAEEFTNIFSTVPRDIEELYTKILDKSRYPDKARRILGIVVAAARPLILREMNAAFRIKREHRSSKDLGDLPAEFGKIVKNWCGLFVRVIDSKIYLVQQTAREFLIKGSASGHGNCQYTLSPVDSNFLLADICISYLSLEDFENEPLVVHPRDCSREAEFDGYVEKYALLDYAASHWADRFRDSQTRQMELLEFTWLVCEGGSKRLLTWWNVYWRKGHHGTVVERLLQEGGDINARSEEFGTALNIAAFREDENITRKLLQMDVKACILGREYNIVEINEERWLKWVVQS
ncbi:hypothetical protein C7212DRAFT_354058 [Tuber magnatum]|uniref:Uncharacterized protein n=1 Tax=Tuber magnatum TaxID=42249 RepID=A0A317SEZ2_9PEZI|nr:hypothetical protein C7212DRAFT_354058 [Tuber magnatum]